MAPKQRRVTALVVLPLQYNPDAQGRRRKVEAEHLRLTMEELAAQFGGGFLWDFGSHSPKGFWWDRGVLYKDDVTVVEIDIPNQASAKRWLAAYARDTLLARFEQEAIYIRFVGPIDTDVVRVVR